jgi:hypothetical protein
MKIILFLFVTVSITIHADTRRVFLGEVRLAGLVPASLPTIGTKLELTDPEQAVLNPKGEPMGYLPVLFRPAIASMQRKGLSLHLEVQHLYVHPRPGNYIRVIVWADTKDLSLIDPLIYDIPIHSEEDLSDYE